MSKKRRQLGNQEKVAILKRHLLEKVPISDLCDEHQLYPNQIYDWLRSSLNSATRPSQSPQWQGTQKRYRCEGA